MLRLAIVLILLSFSCASMAKGGKTDSLVLERVFMYKEGVKDKERKDTSAMYVRYSINTLKRNPALLCVPSMYVIAKGSRQYAGETYIKAAMDGEDIAGAIRQVDVGTIPRHRQAMPSMARYMTPRIYDVTMTGDNLLSPLNRHNRRYYRYIITPLTEKRSEIVFLPKTYNTQLVSGRAIVDSGSGQVLRLYMNGEFDMVQFNTQLSMGAEGYRSLFPETMEINIDFRFLGNKIVSSYSAFYGLEPALADSVAGSHDMALMEQVRPQPLPVKEQEIYSRYDSLHVANSVKTERKAQRWKTVLWDVIGDNLVNRIQGHFGTQDQGYWRISPILNPLYLGYSEKKGLTYKSKIRLRYVFTPNSHLSINLKGGYSFKQRQVYLNLPVRYTFNDRRNGYIQAEIGNGNRITNSGILDEIKGAGTDSIDWNGMNLDYFRDMYMKVTGNYDLSERLSIQPGMIFHRRSAVDSQGFISAGKSTDYRSFAPTLQLQYRPFGWKGLALTADYERGISGVGKSEMDYERVELDASWLYKPTTVRSVSVRLGTGFYTAKSDKAYFLDYSNFRDDNLVGGWNDDWSGDFQLLNSNWYNASEYYVRANATYESPLMLLSRLPLVGRFMEVERIYVSTLFVERLHPYVEYGYGFTNRLFSMGMFCATRNQSFDGFGVKFGFELFGKW